MPLGISCLFQDGNFSSFFHNDDSLFGGGGGGGGGNESFTFFDPTTVNPKSSWFSRGETTMIFPAAPKHTNTSTTTCFSFGDDFESNVTGANNFDTSIKAYKDRLLKANPGIKPALETRFKARSATTADTSKVKDLDAADIGKRKTALKNNLSRENRDGHTKCNLKLMRAGNTLSQFRNPDHGKSGYQSLNETGKVG